MTALGRADSRKGNLLALPARLTRPPLLEAICEIRFDATTDAAGDLLPGLLFSELKGEYPEVSPLPLANVPREFRERDDNLRFQPSHRISGGSRVIQVGDHVLSASQAAPYDGWNPFATRIRRVLSVLRSTELVASVRRCSLRCINLLPAPDGAQLSLLDASFSVAGRPVPETGFQFRTEIVRGGFTSIVQIATNTTANRPGQSPLFGVLVDVDCVCSAMPTDFWSTIPDLIESLHREVKRSFFSLLRHEAISALGPEGVDRDFD